MPSKLLARSSRRRLDSVLTGSAIQRVTFNLAFYCLFAKVLPAAVVVAPSDASDVEKQRADFVCDGVDDQIELASAFAMAKRGKTTVDINPKTQKTVVCAVNHAVEWLPGKYELSATLEIPDAANCAIKAEGTQLIFGPTKGDVIVVRGMNACRYSFGTIASHTDGAAICVQPNKGMPALMSFVDFARLKGTGQRGTGLMLDPRNENICVNRFTGTDVAGFDRGVFVGDAGAREAASGSSSHGKADTNWFWMSYIRQCNTCIQESANGVDCSVWHVNVDASLPDSTAIRAAGKYGKWYVIMGTYTFEGTNKAVVLEPGAQHCVFEVHPPLDYHAWEDNSGSDTNVILSTSNPPHRKFSELGE